MPRIIGPVCGPVATLTGYDGADFRNLLVDALGRLQVDVIDSGLPAGAATAAHQVTMITALQLIDDLRAALNSVTGDSLLIRVISGGLPADAANAAYQAIIASELAELADIPYQGEHYVRTQGTIVGVGDTWTEVITDDVPVGKVWYISGWGGFCATDGTATQFRLEVAGSARHLIRAVTESREAIGICFGKATAGQAVSIDAKVFGAVDKTVHAWYIVIEV